LATSKVVFFRAPRSVYEDCGTNVFLKLFNGLQLLVYTLFFKNTPKI